MEECIICFDENPKFVILECNHRLCKNCFVQIQHHANVCPLCNSALTIKQEYCLSKCMMVCVGIMFCIFIYFGFSYL